jgi:hypothetical protein
MNKMTAVANRAQLEDYRLEILVKPRAKGGATVDAWIQALELAGFLWGDGDLFWKPFSDDQADEGPQICAEPYTVKGYFHCGDRDAGRKFPDIALHEKLSRLGDIAGSLAKMEDAARSVAKPLRATLMSAVGAAYDRDAVLDCASAARRALEEIRWNWDLPRFFDVPDP